MPRTVRTARHPPATDRHALDVPHHRAPDGPSGPSRRDRPDRHRRARPNGLRPGARRDGSLRSCPRPGAGRRAPDRPRRSPDAAHGARRDVHRTNAPHHQRRRATANPHHPPRDATATAGHRSGDRPSNAHHRVDRTSVAHRSRAQHPVAHHAPDRARPGHRGSTPHAPGRRPPRQRGPCLRIPGPRRHRFRGPRRHPGDRGTSRHVHGHRSTSTHGHRPSPPRCAPVQPPKDCSLSVLRRRTNGCRPHRPYSSRPGGGRPPSDAPRPTSRAVHPTCSVVHRTCSAAHRNRTRSQRLTPSDARHPHHRVPRPRYAHQRMCPDAGRARRATTARQRCPNPHVPVLLIARHRAERRHRPRDHCPPNSGATGYGRIRTRRSDPCRPARCSGRLCSRVCRSSMVVPQSPRPRPTRRSARASRLERAPHIRGRQPAGAAPAPTATPAPLVLGQTQKRTAGARRDRRTPVNQGRRRRR